MMRAAEAPSVRYDAFAAVTEPCGLTNAGLSFASFSRVESPRQPVSAREPSYISTSSS